MSTKRSYYLSSVHFPQLKLHHDHPEERRVLWWWCFEAHISWEEEWHCCTNICWMKSIHCLNIWIAINLSFKKKRNFLTWAGNLMSKCECLIFLFLKLYSFSLNKHSGSGCPTPKSVYLNSPAISDQTYKACKSGNTAFKIIN